jgi:broad specificity phosphatase PhoE
MKLLLIRHAESTNNAAGSSDEWSEDPPLTPAGEEQARRLAAYLVEAEPPETLLDGRSRPVRGYGVTHLYCSPMWRSLQTAALLGARLAVEPEVWVELHEEGALHIRPGTPHERWPRGATRAEILAALPGGRLPESLGTEGWWPGGGEARAVCFDRAGQVAERLRARAAGDERIALVSHGNFLDALLKALLHGRDTHETYYLHYNTGLTLVDFYRSRATLWFHNRVEHLPPPAAS